MIQKRSIEYIHPFQSGSLVSATKHKEHASPSMQQQKRGFFVVVVVVVF